MEDDRAPRGFWQAAHWPRPLPSTVWCDTCERRTEVRGQFSSPTEFARELYLDCGHQIPAPPSPCSARQADCRCMYLGQAHSIHTCRVPGCHAIWTTDGNIIQLPCETPGGPPIRLIWSAAAA